MVIEKLKCLPDNEMLSNFVLLNRNLQIYEQAYSTVQPVSTRVIVTRSCLLFGCQKKLEFYETRSNMHSIGIMLCASRVDNMYRRTLTFIA